MIATTSSEEGPRSRYLRSVLAVVVGFVSVAVLSLATDQLFHVLGVYPPWGQPMDAAGLNALALSYRLVYTVLGGYLTARLAPGSPMGHVIVLGIIGFVMAAVGVVVALRMNLGPAWYPIALAATAFPCTWLGGVLRVREVARREAAGSGYRAGAAR